MADAAEVVVIGGGVMGASTLFHLARLGVRDALLLESTGLGAGGTGRSLAILRMHYSNEVVVRMAHASHRVIARFDEETGTPSGFVRTGYCLLAGPGQESALARNVQLGRQVGVRTEMLTVDAARGVLPAGFQLDGVAAVAYEPESGYADSSAVTTGFASAAKAAGARIRLGVRATALRVSGDRIVGVETSEGRIDASTVVLAAGAGTSDLLKTVAQSVPLGFVRHQVVKLHRPLDRLPVHPTVGDVPNGLSFRPDRGDVTLVGIREDPVQPAGYKQTVDAEVAEEALRVTTARMPAMADAGWDGGWVGLFDVTPDWHPVIDRVPGIGGLVCGIGFSGHGFKLSPAVGLALAELAVHGAARTIDMTPLRFTRFAEGELLRSAYGGTVFA
jgi:sarcosine oxidase subunit beta